jgi:hypothetical protein
MSAVRDAREQVECVFNFRQCALIGREHRKTALDEFGGEFGLHVGKCDD